MHHFSAHSASKVAHSSEEKEVQSTECGGCQLSLPLLDQLLAANHPQETALSGAGGAHGQGIKDTKNNSNLLQ